MEMRSNSDIQRDRVVSRRFLILGGIVLVMVVLILLTSRNDDNRIFNVETVYDTVFVATDSTVNSQSSNPKVISHHRSAIPKNPWRGHASHNKDYSANRHPLKYNHENCRLFADAISQLFSPYYYTSINTVSEASSVSPATNAVDLLYETCREDSTYCFGIVCRWFSSCPDDGVEWCSSDTLPLYGVSSAYPVFLVLGIGGSPDVPQELYVLRAWSLRNILSPNFLSKAHKKAPGKKFFFKPDGPWLN